MLFPITFGFPKEKINLNESIKIKILSDIIPGNSSNYTFNKEEDYYNEYQISYFAITKKKAGWDCLRHYEILANGCIPYFIDIKNCPKNTMALLPKDLLNDANILFETKFKNKNINELSDESIKEYNELKSKLIYYFKNNLTTQKIASYILQKSNFENISSILYLSGDSNPDYLRCLTLHGFKKLLGNKCHDYPKINHIYKSENNNYNSLYGKGFTYTNLLENDYHNDELDNTIMDDIKNKFYDIIIFGSFHRGIPFYELICENYKSNEIIMLCGEDLHNCNNENFLKKGHILFVREL